MNTLKKQLAFLLVFSILFSLLSGLSAKAALPSTPTLKDNKIFANGHPIVIEAGEQDPNKTRIRYDNDKYLIFGSDYYAKAVSWAIANGITNGTDKDTLHPNAECNRAQILTFLYRFASLSEKK